MIQDKRQIQISASSHVIFDLIDRMPNKFPIYKFLETKPFFFLRVLLVDGPHAAWEAASLKRPDDTLKLNEGDTMGPFTLTVLKRPTTYWFTLKSFFFNCETGYSLHSKEGITELTFDLIAEDPTFKEKIWWFIFKPFHSLFANKVLRVIKEKIESGECCVSRSHKD